MDRTSFDRLFDMAGRTVVVTGGTRGIGLALAEGCVLAGAQVVVASRKPDACEQAAAHLRGMGGAAIGVPTDFFTPIFAAARTLGWAVHFQEQWDSGNRIFRPKQIYTGERRLDFRQLVGDIPSHDKRVLLKIGARQPGEPFPIGRKVRVQVRCREYPHRVLTATSPLA